jgi:hypothetical protein
MTTIRVGTRASLLATTQARHVADLVEARLGRPVELVEVTTEGDRSAAPLATMGGTGVFVTALREALVGGRIDIAVHSLKDLPTTPDPRIALAAVPPREDPRDVVVARDGLTLGELPAGSRVGTGSPRRAAPLHATPAPPSRPSAPSSRPWRAGAPPRSGSWPRWPRATTATSCGSAPSRCRPTAPSPYGCPSPEPLSTPPIWAHGSQPTCSPRERAHSPTHRQKQ